MPEITEPLRLATGSHAAGSGKGCAMNVISWENGDTTITDFPACSDRLLARIVQGVNDSLCTHATDDSLCPDCSVKVLELGHRTVGTGDIGLTELERRQVWVAIAADQARQVLHLADATRHAVALACIEAAEAWATEPTEANRQAAGSTRQYAYAAYAATDAKSLAHSQSLTIALSSGGADAAADAADAADAAAAYAATAYAAYAYAATAYAATAYAATDGLSRLVLAHRAIDKFEELTKFKADPINPETTADAVCKMREIANVH